MNQEAIRNFIIIDDDSLSNTICAKIIQLSVPGSATVSFTDPGEGLEYIYSKYKNINDEKVVLFLDINMPDITGWDVLHKIEEIPGLTQQGLKIFMLSSSVSPDDKQKAALYSLVSGFISKPLSNAKLGKLLQSI